MQKLLITVFLATLIFNTHWVHGQIQSSELKKVMNKAQKKFNIPAIATVIVNSNDILLSEIRGVRIHNTTQEATLNDYFHIGSCSKSVLALIAGKLVEEDRINWDTPFFDVFPELKKISMQEYHNITLLDLFLCRAGIQPYTSGEEKFPVVDSALSNPRYEFANYLVQQPPASKFKNEAFEFLYSNASYTMASLMLEKISTLSYEQLIDCYLGKELSIETWIGFPNTFDPNQPWGHLMNGNSFDIFPPDHPYMLSFFIRPAGDLSMTPLSFAKYIQMNLKGLKGKDNFVKSSTYQKLHFGYGGFSIGVANGKMAGKKYSGMDGSAGTFFCRAIIVPDSDLAFTIMTNAGSGTGQMKAVDWLTMAIVKKYYNWWWKFWL